MKRRRITSYDVAKRAGVSRATVSFVLNNVDMNISEETRRRVLEVARELGYVPDAAAQALASRRAQTIGLFLSRNPYHIDSDTFLTQLIDGLLRSIQKHGMRLLLEVEELKGDVNAFMRLVQAKRIDGLVLSGPRFEEDALQKLEHEGFPTVLMGQIPGNNFYAVDVDNRVSARLAVEHLLKLGHTEIGCITNAKLIYAAPIERLQGYKDAMESRNIPYKESLIREGDFTPESGYEQMKSLLEDRSKGKNNLTAMFVASDVLAFGAIAAIREHRLKIPRDISLVGFDDVPLSRYVTPPLTTVHLPAIEIGRNAGEILIRLIGGKEPPQRQILLDTALVVRESCGVHGNENNNTVHSGT